MMMMIMAGIDHRNFDKRESFDDTNGKGEAPLQMDDDDDVNDELMMMKLFHFTQTNYRLLKNNASPSKQEVEDHFDGNICRCTGL
jgi:hypothetical protein